MVFMIKRKSYIFAIVI